MESTVATEKINHWRTGDLSSLAQHFHQYDGKSQYQRLAVVYLGTNSINNLFTQKNGIEIGSFDITFALDSQKSSDEQFSFMPMVTVKLQGKNIEPVNEFLTESFEYQKPESLTDNTTIVPHIFKEWLANNWLELDSGLMDDVFTAYLSDKEPAITLFASQAQAIPSKRLAHRLLGYHFSPPTPDNAEGVNLKFLDFIKKNIGNIAEFNLHLGVDMNKFHRREYFTFSPIVEVKTKQMSDKMLSKHRRDGFMIYDNKDESHTTYFDYMMPCPSTCS